jgi:hypothetical protein
VVIQAAARAALCAGATAGLIVSVWQVPYTAVCLSSWTVILACSFGGGWGWGLIELLMHCMPACLPACAGVPVQLLSRLPDGA